MIRNKFILSVAVIPFLLSGCTGLGLATGAAAVTGISAAQEGGISRALSDTGIKLRINEAWFKYNVDAFAKLGTSVNQGRVLLTGVVQDPNHRLEAVRLAWQVPGVKQVMNEIQVANSKGITGYIKDGWISSRLRGSLTLDRSVQSINYSIETVQSIVYLMGVAQNQAELNRVIETARTISGVKQVVSYVKLAGQPLVGQQLEQPVANATVTAQPQTLHSQTSGVQTYTQQPQGTYNSVQPTYSGTVQAQPQVQTQPQLQFQPRIQPQYLPQGQIQSEYRPVENYGPIVSESDRMYIDQGVDVPAVSVPTSGPSIADRYYQ